MSPCRDSGFSEVQATELLKESTGIDCRDALKSFRAEAIAEKAFGVPYMVLDGQGVEKWNRHWFGADSLYSLGMLLGHPMSPFDLEADASAGRGAMQQSKL